MPTAQHALLLLLAVASTTLALRVARPSSSSSSSSVLMPSPFTDVLRSGARGNEVVLAQMLLRRSPYVSATVAAAWRTGEYDATTAAAVAAFQRGQSLRVEPSSRLGVLDATTATLLLALHSDDGVRDSTALRAADFGCLYKISVPVHTANRSVETSATLFDAANTPLLRFPVRAHGHDAALPAHESWPSYSNTVGLNQFSSDGATPTGVMLCDLNSPEPSPTLYGPYPINRMVAGIDGNAATLLANNTVHPMRSGILLHTGEWPGWHDGNTMPNSAGCMHSYPRSIETLWHTLTSLGVVVHNNTGGALPYPYTPQGLCVVYNVDEH